MGSTKKIQIERLKGSGPGGQHRNKRETGVRVTDPENQISVRATRLRSQAQNLKTALEELEKRVIAKKKKPKRRLKTKPHRGAVEKRISAKKHRSSAKKQRSVPRDD